MPSPLAQALQAGWEGSDRRVVAIEGGQTWTAGALLDRGRRIGDSLSRAGLAPDEPVIVLVSNRAVDFSAFLAVWSRGGVVVPVHRATPPAALLQTVSTAGAHILIDAAEDESWPDSVTSLEVENRWPGVLRRPGRSPAVADPCLRGAAVVVFTSGSSGRPKGVVLSHAALHRKLANNGAILSFDQTARTQLVLQITFSFGLWLSLLTLTRRGTLVLRRKFVLAEALSDLARFEVNRTAWVPTMLRGLVAARGAPGIEDGLQALRDTGRLAHLYTGGELYPAPLAAAVADAFPGLRVFNIFGLTETCTSDFVLGPDALARHPGTIGRPAPDVDFRIVDDRGTPVAPGAVGELQIRTATVMTGYLGQPELTRAAFADGFFRTGDLARRAGEVVEVVGRAKEVISRGANKIYPQEIEQALLCHSDVGEALAAGIADSILGERLHVAVVAKPGHRLDPEDLRRWMAERLEKFKLPDAVHLLDSLPIGRTGKSDRAALKALVAPAGG